MSVQYEYALKLAQDNTVYLEKNGIPAICPWRTPLIVNLPPQGSGLTVDPRTTQPQQTLIPSQCDNSCPLFSIKHKTGALEGETMVRLHCADRLITVQTTDLQSQNGSTLKPIK